MITMLPTPTPPTPFHPSAVLSRDPRRSPGAATKSSEIANGLSQRPSCPRCPSTCRLPHPTASTATRSGRNLHRPGPLPRRVHPVRRVPSTEPARPLRARKLYFDMVENARFVPDGAFVLENHENDRRGLFFVECDMGTERITAPRSRDQRSTIKGKLELYDRYLASGRFASTYTDYGEFRSFLLLFVTMSEERIGNIRQACVSLPPQLHLYYRFATLSDVMMDFLGSVWLTRDSADTKRHALIQERN
jgi:hypothetical protein